MSSYFSVEGGNLLSKRWQRIANFGRIPAGMSVRLLMMYAKKLFRLRTSDREEQQNYYFLTLLNCDAASVKVGAHEYEFRTRTGTSLLAREQPSSDLEVCNQVWGRKEYGLATDILQKKGSNAPLTIVDLGANVGYSTLYFLEKFPTARIFSVEPDKDNFNQLERMITLNKAEDRIVPIQLGIWSHKANLFVDRSFRDNRDWSIRVEESDTDTGLRGAHLLDIMRDHQIDTIDLLKIDIEGAERFIFTANDKTDNLLSKVNVLALEIHDEYVSRQEIYRMLEKNGFTLFDFNDLTIASRE